RDPAPARQAARVSRAVAAGLPEPEARDRGSARGGRRERRAAARPGPGRAPQDTRGAASAPRDHAHDVEPQSVCRAADGGLALPARVLDPRQGAGSLGPARRALLRHAWLPRTERQPAAGARDLLARMPESFLKKALRDFHPYVPGEQPPDGEGWVKLNTNESPLP